MKTNKCGVYAALAAVLLIAAVLIASCMDPAAPSGFFAPKKGDTKVPFVPPAGKGYVMLKLGRAGETGRTIRPPSSELISNPEDFDHFDVLFKSDDGSSTPGTADLTNGLDMTYSELEDTPFVLDPGNYIVEVYAFKVTHAASDLGNAAAFGATTLEVNAQGEGTFTEQTIHLSEIDNNDLNGTGIFTYLLDSNSSIDAAALTITPYGDTTPVGGYNGKDITGILGDSISLPPGYYSVKIALSGTKVASKTVHEILHVYQGMTSYYGGTMSSDDPPVPVPMSLPTLNRNVYDVTFKYGDARDDDGKSMDGSSDSDEYTHGDTITAPADPLNKYVKSLSPLEYDTTLEIQTWYTENRSDTNTGITDGTWDSSKAFTMGTTKVFRDTNLFARWKKTGIIVSIDFVYNTSTLTTGSITLVNKGSNTPFTGLISLLSPLPEVTITFTSPKHGDPPQTDTYTVVEWLSGDDDVDLSSITTNSFDINFALPAYEAWLTAGDQEITLSVLNTLNNQPESITIKFNVQ